MPSALRLVIFAFTFLTSVYCMMAYIPFVWHQFIRFHHFTAITLFVKTHPFLYWALWGAALWSLRHALGASWRRPAVAAALAPIAVAGLWLAVRPLLTYVQNDAGALAGAILCWLPYFALEGLLVRHGAWGLRWEVAQDPGEDARYAVAAFRWAVLLAGAYAAIALVRAQIGRSGFSLGETAVAAVWSGVDHLCLAAVLWAVLVLARAAAANFRRPPLAEAAFLGAAAVAAAAGAWERLVMELIPFGGLAAWAHAVVVALGAAVCWAAECRSRVRGPIAAGADFWSAPLSRPLSGAAGSPFAAVGAQLAWVAVAAILSAWVPRLDWNGIIQSCVVLALWSAAFMMMRAITPGPAIRRWHFAAVWGACLGVFLLRFGLDKARPLVNSGLASRGTRVSAVLEALEGWDPSFKLAHRLLNPPKAGSGEAADLFAFLSRNTNVSREIAVAAPDIRLVPGLTAAAGPRPHVFIIVVDSLRRDYLGAYDPRVRFTPALDAFAKDAVVFNNAFTRYGATGLSQPSIWTGTAMLHKQYIEPFAPMNALQKLVEADGYHGLITRDSILSVVVTQGPLMENFEPGVLDRNFTLCRSLDTLLKRVDAGVGGRPIFAYTQPQDVHVSVINRESRTVDGGAAAELEGFDPPYASRVRRVDRCFGAFVEGLKRRKLYDDSIIIVTSDHGDSLGEGGRWGHAYTLFPEILRIPLLIRVPKRLRGLYRDPEAVAFSMDVTPTLYGLLGHGLTANDPIHGRPLFTATRAGHDAYLRGDYLIASSYGPVYAILSGDAGRLYIADGVNLRKHHFDLLHDPKGERNILSPEVESAMDERLREEVGRVAAYYGLAR